MLAYLFFVLSFFLFTIALSFSLERLLLSLENILCQFQLIVNRENTMLATENKLNAKILSMENFGGWLLEEIEKRGLSQSDLVRMAGISRGTLSNIISGTRGVGNESMVAIANALKISPITIFRKAGLLPDDKNSEASFDDWQHILSQLTKDEQEEIRQIVELKIERRQKAEKTERAANFKQSKVKK